MAVGEVKFKVGDKVVVKVPEPQYGWGYVEQGEVGVVATIHENGEVDVHFPSQADWMAAKGELQLVEKKARKSPEKILGYAVLNKNGETKTMTTDREFARFFKASMGGKKAGVTIVTVKAGKEIR